MVKIRCGDNFGIDLNEVTAWSKSDQGQPNERELINLFLVGADCPIYVYRELVGCQAFTHLHKLLLDRFAIDLASSENAEGVLE